MMDKVQKATEAGRGVGVRVGRDVTRMPFFKKKIFTCVRHPVRYGLFFCFLSPTSWRERTQQRSGTAKECSLHSYRVNGWMNGVINEWVNGRA